MLNTLYSLAFISLSLLIGHLIFNIIGGLPASLYGMVIFTLLLHYRVCQAEKVKASITWGIRNMGVCFVPAGVGIINQYQLIKTHGLALVAIIFITTFLVLTLVGMIFQRLEDKATTGVQ